MSDPRPKILITLGDPAGVGPEVIEKALQSGELPDDFDFEVVGEPARGTPGKPDANSARESLRALQMGGERWRDDPNVRAIVTGPVSKSQLESVGFPFPGQTEFFADLSCTERVAMCLSGDRLTVSLATIHIPLAEVASTLSVKTIVSNGLLLESFLRSRGLENPRIAVAGLNPHAGEMGRFGDEESRVISPAMEEFEKRVPGVFSGPRVPDAVFREALDGRFDAVLAMYHDQGLIPLKLVDFDSAVNVTLGLPKPRTSPDHGTAFDIAGQGRARPESMIRAIRLACELATNHL